MALVCILKPTLISTSRTCFGFDSPSISDVATEDPGCVMWKPMPGTSYNDERSLLHKFNLATKHVLKQLEIPILVAPEGQQDIHVRGPKL